MSDALTLGIDIGTSGIRTAVLRGDQPISAARAAHLPQSGDAIDAELWWAAVRTCLLSQVATLRDAGLDPQNITRLAVDGTSGSMVLTDANLRPVSPALMYNSKGFDAEAKLISRLAPAAHITQGSNSALARAMRLLSMAKGQPVHLLHQADFILARLAGRGGVSDDNNALKTGFDPASERWPDWISEVLDPGLLPQVHRPGAPVHRIDKDQALALGLSPDLALHAGTTDSIAAFLAGAPLQRGAAVTSLGSTLAIKLLSEARLDDPASGLYSHRLGDLWLVGGASNTGGAVLAAHFSTEQLRALSTRIDPETDSELDYYPLRDIGERFPINDPALAPRLTPRPKDDALFLHGMFDAMARIEAKCYDRIRAAGGSAPRVIHTAGGGAQNPVWTRIRARALPCPLKAAQHSEASIGVARLANSDGEVD